MQTISVMILQHVCLISLNRKNVTIVVSIHAFYFTPVLFLTPGDAGQSYWPNLRRVVKWMTNTVSNTDYTSVGPEFAYDRYKY